MVVRVADGVHERCKVPEPTASTIRRQLEQIVRVLYATARPPIAKRLALLQVRLLSSYAIPDLIGEG